ncbi:hypothetical protein [uncultured Jatrophihabitans sp.]|uniref:hypothetical protein n=1 Tax=uncultured Jatrophihabitans sp. TaxID=1610747 RepID=UPI0035CBB4FC
MGDDPRAGIVAIVVILLLGLVLRWIFKPSRPRSITRPVDAAQSPDLGLLTVVLTGVSRQEALERRARLGEADIRSSMSRRRDGTMDVLVFHGDADAARILLGT